MVQIIRIEIYSWEEPGPLHLSCQDNLAHSSASGADAPHHQLPFLRGGHNAAFYSINYFKLSLEHVLVFEEDMPHTADESPALAFLSLRDPLFQIL